MHPLQKNLYDLTAFNLAYLAIPFNLVYYTLYWGLNIHTTLILLLPVYIFPWQQLESKSGHVFSMWPKILNLCYLVFCCHLTHPL